MRKRTGRNLATLLLFVGFLLQACSTGPRIITNSDPAADWSSYRTFSFFEPLATDRGNVRSLECKHVHD